VRVFLALTLTGISGSAYSLSGAMMRHGVNVVSPSSWEPQEEGMMSIVANFPSIRNQGLSNPGKSQTQEGDAC
jgi:hypothetical protein